MEKGLENLRLCTQLRALELTADREIPLTFLGELEALTDLTVYGAQTLTVAEAFAKLSRLRKLALTEATLTLDRLRPTLSGLRSLYLAEIKGVIDMLDFPESAPLEVLALNKCEVSNWSSIGGLRHLRVLRLAACHLVPDRLSCSSKSLFDLSALANCVNLHSLSLLKTDVLGTSFRALRELPTLQKLEVGVGTSQAVLGPLRTTNIEIVHVRD